MRHSRMSMFSACLLTVVVSASPALSQVVISQVYGGGGNTGAVYTHDFVELFNRGSQAVLINNWSLQYTSSGGTSWASNKYNLPFGSIPAGGYWLVQMAGGTNGVPLPTPDGTSTINMSGTAGKIALVNSTTSLPAVQNPSADPSVVDFVGFGPAATGYEGSGPTVVLSSGTAAVRKAAGCTDTNDNAADFDVAPPAARNSGSTPAPCDGGSTPPSGAGSTNNDPAPQGSAVVFTVTVNPGTNPPSTGLQVLADLTEIGGSANQAFANVGGNVFSYTTVLPCTQATGPVLMPVTIADAEGRANNAWLEFTVSTRTLVPPTGVSVNAGQTAIFASGINDAGATFQWHNAAGPLSDGGKISGSSTATLTIADAGAAEAAAGPYKVVATGTCDGVITYENLTLTISANPVVISQIYGGGGNSGALWKNDFIELFNKSGAAVDLSSWSVQYTSSAGTSWQKTDLTGSIPAGGYYLIQQAAGTGAAPALPTPDSTGTIAMSATTGKVALVASQTVIESGTSCPSGAVILDLVGYGGTACYEGSGPTGVLSNSTAALRQLNGCQDTNNNLADFAIGEPAPRNTASPTYTCPSSTSPTAAAVPSSTGVAQGAAVTITVTVTPGMNPDSTGIQITGDLTAVGGSAAQAFTDTGGNVFTYTIAVPCEQPVAIVTLPITVTDAQTRSGATSATFTVFARPDVTGPSNAKACVGGSAQFRSGINDALATFQWYNGSDQPLSDGGSISGATTATLTISNVQAADVAAGPYKLVATGTCDGDLAFDGLTLSLDAATAEDKQVIISQVYGGAGCGTPDCSLYKNDFVELYNSGTTPVSLAGWSIQYASAANPFSSATPLSDFTLQPGQYYLIRLSGAASANGTLSIPSYNVAGDSSLSATVGKIALVKNTAVLMADACVGSPQDCLIVDMVGYGTTASCYEGSGRAPAPGSNSNSISRDLCSGTPDTDDNAADFTAGPANPHAGGSYASAGASPDFTGDSKVNLDDFEIFKACATGPAVLYDVQNLPVGCTAVPGCGGTIGPDLDQNGTVDMNDFGIFQRCFSGDVNFNANCLN